MRPDPGNLYPYVDHEYTPNLAAGNPALKPQFTQSYETGYGFEGHRLSYALTGYYRRNRDAVTDVTEYLGNGISLTTKTNLPRNDSEGLEFTANGRIATELSYNVSGNLFRSQIDASALGIAGLQSTTGINFNGQRYKRLLSTPNLSEEYQRSIRGRIMYVGFVCAFGISRKERQSNFEYEQAG